MFSLRSVPSQLHTAFTTVNTSDSVSALPLTVNLKPRAGQSSDCRPAGGVQQVPRGGHHRPSG